jgi:hypothetical protein
MWFLALISTSPVSASPGASLYRVRMRHSLEQGVPMQLAEILPSLASELEQLLNNQGEAELAVQVSQLAIVDRCRCGDDFCSSFYTRPKPEGHYGPGHRCMDLDAAEGMLLVDLVEGKIAHIEILNRVDVRRKLLALFP